MARGLPFHALAGGAVGSGGAVSSLRLGSGTRRDAVFSGCGAGARLVVVCWHVPFDCRGLLGTVRSLLYIVLTGAGMRWCVMLLELTRLGALGVSRWLLSRGGVRLDDVDGIGAWWRVGGASGYGLGSHRACHGWKRFSWGCSAGASRRSGGMSGTEVSPRWWSCWGVGLDACRSIPRDDAMRRSVYCAH